jgi:hypothetical protein
MAAKAGFPAGRSNPQTSAKQKTETLATRWSELGLNRIGFGEDLAWWDCGVRATRSLTLAPASEHLGGG